MMTILNLLMMMILKAMVMTRLTMTLMTVILMRTVVNIILMWDVVGRGGALVETMTCNRRVVGSIPALAAT